MLAGAPIILAYEQGAGAKTCLPASNVSHRADSWGSCCTRPALTWCTADCRRCAVLRMKAATTTRGLDSRTAELVHRKDVLEEPAQVLLKGRIEFRHLVLQEEQCLLLARVTVKRSCTSKQVDQAKLTSQKSTSASVSDSATESPELRGDVEPRKAVNCCAARSLSLAIFASSSAALALASEGS